ncbi:Protein quiver [Camponotus japonicus]
MEIRSSLITILVVAFALLHYGEARKCYSCDSINSKTCASEPSSTEITECLNTCGICNFKLSNGAESLIRFCVTNYSLLFSNYSSNYSPRIDSFNCAMCYEDFCNNANMVTVSMKALGCLVSFWVIRFVLTNSY